MPGLLPSLLRMPATCAVCAANVAVSALLYTRGVPPEDVALSYRRFVKERQLWRAITASFAHYNLLHLVFNVAAVYNLGSLEARKGTFYYLRATVLLLLTCDCIAMGIYHFLIKTLGRRDLKDAYAVGYSSVAFGLMAIEAAQSQSGRLMVFGRGVPAVAAPFASLLLTQVMVPNASFTGHLAGIVAGFVLAAGALDWFGTTAMLEVLLWGGVALVWSLKVSSRLPMGWVVVEDDAPRSLVIENGVARPRAAPPPPAAPQIVVD